MGLRINNNLSAIRALRNLKVNDRVQATSLERLATGLRINRAADDPSGLIISEQLRSQLNALKQAVENTENASGLLAVADNALDEISKLLTDVKDAVVFAQNTGGSSPEQIAAEQDMVDQSIAAIDRISATTRYSKRQLLNGNSAYTTSTNVPAGIDNLRIRGVFFEDSDTSNTQDFVVDVTQLAERARTALAADSPVGAVVGNSVIRVTGPLGTQDIALANGAVAADVRGAINAAAGFTGVVASAADGLLYTTDFGEAAVVQWEVISGTTVNGRAPGFKFSDTGVNAQITVNDFAFEGVGNNFNILLPSGEMEFSIAPNIAAVGNVGTITVRNTGLAFQMREQPNSADKLFVGIDSTMASVLGMDRADDNTAAAQAVGNAYTLAALGYDTAAQAQRLGGFLSSIKTGAGNDLFQNARNASFIVDRAIDQVSTLRGYLGAVIANNLQPNADNLEVEIENLTAAESTIRDLDFAEETANFTRAQILFQAGTAVMASANLIPQTVLTLLQ